MNAIAYPDEQETILKVPPHSSEAERAVLGSILIDPNAKNFVSLLADHFYRTEHRLIYAACRACDEPDIVTVAEELDRIGKLDEAGGIAYLDRIISATPTAANVASYAKVVREKAMLRDGITVAYEISGAGFEGDLKAMNRAMADCILKVSGGDTRDQWSAKASVQAVLERADRASRGEVSGVPFGIRPMDSVYRVGMEPGDLIILGGRPSMGKTSFLLKMALSGSVPVGFASLEMTHEQLSRRAICQMAGVSYEQLNMGDLNDREWDRVGRAATEYAAKPLHIFDRGGLTVDELMQAATVMKHKHNIGLLIVDYLQLLSGEGNNRNEEVGAMSRALKGLAKRLRIPVVLACQVNRKCEERQNKRPLMSDLRESGQIEQDADMIIFLYRDAMYNDVPDITLEALVEKCRNGPVKQVFCGWEGRQMMVTDSVNREVNAY